MFTDLDGDLGDSQHYGLLLGQDIPGLIDACCDEEVQKALFQKVAHVLSRSDQHLLFLHWREEKPTRLASRPGRDWYMAYFPSPICPTLAYKSPGT